MHRKEIGNGAPNDGFGLTEVHGWALGSITTPSPQTYYIDDASVYGTAPVRPLTVGFSTLNYPVTEGATAVITAKLSKISADPVTVEYATTIGPAIPDRDYTPVYGTLTFPPNITEQSFTLQTIDNQKYQGERGVLVELSNPTGGAALGLPPIARVDILDNEAFYPPLLDDFESYPYLWSASWQARISNPEIPAGDAMALPGQGAYEHVLQVGPKNSHGHLRLRSHLIPSTRIGALRLGVELLVLRPEQQKERPGDGRQTTRRSPTTLQTGGWCGTMSSTVKQAPRRTRAFGGTKSAMVRSTAYPAGATMSWNTTPPALTTSATDGKGNLVITTKKADGSLMCYYGPCQYTSARLLTQNRFEVAYGRVEARDQGSKGAGLWPAFWMLGTDINQVGWPRPARSTSWNM